MNKKIIGLVVIALFALSALPMTFTAEAQAVKTTQEIDSGTTPLLLDATNTNFAKSPITPQAKPAPQPKSYALQLEIDYIDGQFPTADVLNYLVGYYAKQNVAITYTIDDSVPLTKVSNDGDAGVSDAEFWAIEASYNDGLSKAVDFSDGNVPSDAKYTLPQKWVLYGTTVQGAATTVGYTYCIGNFRDLVAGNYIYVADKAADAWASTKGVTPAGAEAVLLMHEFGHSIGICTVRAGGETYCTNYYCVMSYLRTQNAGNFGQWYYCSNHWKTKNLDYYVV